MNEYRVRIRFSKQTHWKVISSTKTVWWSSGKLRPQPSCFSLCRGHCGGKGRLWHLFVWVPTASGLIFWLEIRVTLRGLRQLPASPLSPWSPESREMEGKCCNLCRLFQISSGSGESCFSGLSFPLNVVVMEVWPGVRKSGSWVCGTTSDCGVQHELLNLPQPEAPHLGEITTPSSQVLLKNLREGFERTCVPSSSCYKGWEAIILSSGPILDDGWDLRRERP